MSWSNFHSHCTFCDGKSQMEDFVRFAISKGIISYGFSSHAPLPFHTKWTMHPDDFCDYEKEFYRLKEKYTDKIDLYFGLEVDYIQGCTDIKSDYFQDKKLDYSIGSIHYLDKISENNFWSIDGAFRDFDNGLSLLYNGDIQAGTESFYKATKQMIEKGGFDIAGHADKITLHARKYRKFDIEKSWFRKPFEEILEMIKERGIILEINTKAYREHGITFPHISFLGLINELNIPVHVNSDCHYPTNVTESFRSIYSILKKSGLKKLHILLNNQWQDVSFNENGIK